MVSYHHLLILTCEILVHRNHPSNCPPSLPPHQLPLAATLLYSLPHQNATSPSLLPSSPTAPSYLLPKTPTLMVHTPAFPPPTTSHLSTFFFTPRFHHRLLHPPPPPSSSSPLSAAQSIFQIRCSSSNSDDHRPDPSSILSLLLSIPDWADAVKERGMRKRRPLYTPDKWRDHRSSRRHLRHLLSSLSSRVILSLIPPVSAFTAVAALIAGYNSAVSAGWLPGYLPLLRASSLPYQLTAPALALLLVFRTEASYSRYVEGRKAWMGVMAGSSELAAMVMSMRVGEGTEDSGTKKALLSYILAFPVALKCHVISGSDVKSELQDLLEEDDLEVVLSSKHRPRCIIEFISQSLQILHMEETKRNLLESKMSHFHEGVLVCEQLMGIPIPLSYTRLTSRFLVLWHLTLPVILWDDCNWIVVPATFISAASLFCIEEVGVLIEEPFPMLGLDELCRMLHGNIQEVAAIENSVKGRVLDKRKRHIGWDSVNGWPNS